MLKIKIDAKELKTITEKVLCNIDNRSKIETLKCIKLNSINEILSFHTTTLEQFLTVTTSEYTAVNDGTICINNEDFSLLLKMKNEIELTEQEGKLIVKNGNKTLKMNLQDTESFPSFPEEELTEVFKMKESEFAEALKNLYSWTMQGDTKPILTCYNFNLKHNRAEALDGYRIGLKSLVSLNIIDNDKNNVTLQNEAYNRLKKTISEKNTGDIAVSINKKYVCVKGEDFTFYNRQVEGEYIDVEKTIPMTNDHSFTTDSKEFEQVVKYNLDILKADKTIKKPITLMVLYGNNEGIYSHCATQKFETIDKIETKNLQVTKEFKLAFNAQYLSEALKIVDAEQIEIKANGEFHPMMVYGEQYSFLILPVRFKEDWNKVIEKIEQNRAA